MQFGNAISGQNFSATRSIRRQIGLKKNFKKDEKKACQPVAPSTKRGIDATNRRPKPFKKTLKKVKKKLVSVRKI